jgi:hypothetical protein
MPYRSNAKSAPLFLFFCLILFSSAGLAQETPYTADSLMAAFNKGPQNSPKGIQITFTGTIAEIKPTGVVFKSSSNDKVICEPISSVRFEVEGHPVGSALTVVGKVRGRGALGNVTLDQCSLVLTDVASNKPAAIETPDDVSREEVIDLSREVITDGIPVAAAGVADVVPSPSATPATPDAKTPAVAKPSKPVSTNKREEPKRAVTTSVQPAERVQEGSSFPKTDSCGVYRTLSAVLLGIIALVFIGKLRVVAGGLRKPTGVPTEAARRAALEALLTKSKTEK